jgi:hypothetical protein
MQLTFLNKNFCLLDQSLCSNEDNEDWGGEVQLNRWDMLVIIISISSIII